MSELNAEQQKYILPDIERITNLKSKYSDTIKIDNLIPEMKIGEMNILEYIFSNIYPGIRVSASEGVDLNQSLQNALTYTQDRVEEEACIDISERLFNQLNTGFTLGTNVIFIDNNRLLGTSQDFKGQNSYGKLIAEKAGKQFYKHSDYLAYDIYRAGEILKMLYINVPSNIVNSLGKKCRTYLEIINLLNKQPIKDFCDNNPLLCSRKTELNMTLFKKVYDAGEFAWIKSEMEKPDIFNTIFNETKDERESVRSKVMKVNIMIAYMDHLARQDMKNFEFFNIQIRNGTQRPYTKEILQLSDEVYHFWKLRLLPQNINDMNFEIPTTESAINTNINKIIIGGPIAYIYRFSNDIDVPNYKIFSFDSPIGGGWRDIGTYVTENLLTKFLGLTVEESENIISNTSGYEQLYQKYNMLLIPLVRNKI